MSVYSITEHEEDFRNENLGSDVSWSDLLAANYHSLTSSSYGVLSDVRTGGLKRDLSLAFTQKAEPIWSDYFTGPLFVDRIEYLKEIPMIEGTKANIWWDEGNAAIHDKRFVIDGPPWNVLKDFHNKWHDVEKISTWNASIVVKLVSRKIFYLTDIPALLVIIFLVCHLPLDQICQIISGGVPLQLIKTFSI